MRILATIFALALLASCGSSGGSNPSLAPAPVALLSDTPSETSSTTTTTPTVTSTTTEAPATTFYLTPEFFTGVATSDVANIPRPQKGLFFRSFSWEADNCCGSRLQGLRKHAIEYGNYVHNPNDSKRTTTVLSNTTDHPSVTVTNVENKSGLGGYTLISGHINPYTDTLPAGQLVYSGDVFLKAEDVGNFNFFADFDKGQGIYEDGYNFIPASITMDGSIVGMNEDSSLVGAFFRGDVVTGSVIGPAYGANSTYDNPVIVERKVVFLGTKNDRLTSAYFPSD